MPEEFHPFRDAWLHPRRTIRQVLERDPELYVVPLVAIGGINSALGRASQNEAGDNLSLAAILAMAAILGPLGGLLSVWIGSWWLCVTGSWIGGNAFSENVRAAIAWSSIPTLATMPLWIPVIAVFGIDAFTAAPLNPGPEAYLYYGVAAIEVIFGIWRLVLLCNMLAAVQGFASAWAGLGNLVVAFLAFFLPLLGLVFLFVA